MTRSKTAECWNCACLHDCPYANGKTRDCEYFIASRITQQKLAKLLGVSLRWVREPPIAQNRIIKRLLKQRGYQLVITVSTAMNKHEMYLKIPFENREMEIEIRGKTK